MTPIVSSTSRSSGSGASSVGARDGREASEPGRLDPEDGDGGYASSRGEYDSHDLLDDL